MNLERLFLCIAITLFTFYGLMGLSVLVCYMVGINSYSVSFLLFPLGFILTMVLQKKHMDGELKMRKKIGYIATCFSVCRCCWICSF